MIKQRNSKLGLQMAGFVALVAIMVVLAGQVMAGAQIQKTLVISESSIGDSSAENNGLCYRECSFSR